MKQKLIFSRKHDNKLTNQPTKTLQSATDLQEMNQNK